VLLGPDYKPEFDSFRDWLVEIARIRNVRELLERVVTMLAARPHVSLARIWLIRPGEHCESCDMAPRCSNRELCLQLAASAGSRRTEGRPDWSRIDGEYARIPLGVGKVGRVGAAGEAVVVKDFSGDPLWGIRYPWAVHQQIRGLDIQPVKFGDEMLGAIAVFTSIPTPEQGPVWLRIFADEIAAAIVNARAFEEIERLRSQLELQNTYLQEEVREAKALGDIIGQHPSMKRLLRQIDMVAPTDATVLILGESGTGKELVAREVHRRSPRGQRPLIRVNCASVPRELYESEFFGHVKGAFTGAIKDRAGRFEAADGGTLFLDEVAEIPLGLQSKFLRVLQEQQYERVGEERTRSVDVRIIAATNSDLRREMEQGRFREDLYYRLNVFPVEVPPLRHRKEDIPLLAAHFLAQAAKKFKVDLPRFTESQAELLQAYDWPGNVRELQNSTERALISAHNGNLCFDLSASSRDCGTAHSDLLIVGAASPALLREEDIKELERANLVAALQQAKWKVHGPGGAAELLGVPPTTLMSRIKKFGIVRPRGNSPQISGPRFLESGCGNKQNHKGAQKRS
jgi:transcriptional regulator with GAF, ATPase, and Fis domain